MSFMKDRLTERSTWIGLTGIATALGFQFTSLELENFVTIAVGISGFISMLWPDPAK